MTMPALRARVAAPVHCAGLVPARGGVEPFNTLPCGPQHGVDWSAGHRAQGTKTINQNVHWEGVS